MCSFWPRDNFQHGALAWHRADGRSHLRLCVTWTELYPVAQALASENWSKETPNLHKQEKFRGERSSGGRVTSVLSLDLSFRARCHQTTAAPATEQFSEAHKNLAGQIAAPLPLHSHPWRHSHRNRQQASVRLIRVAQGGSYMQPWHVWCTALSLHDFEFFHVRATVSRNAGS
jgi:hypothetical protein